jgi:hypothetical protein
MKIKNLQAWTVLAVLLAGGGLVLAQRNQFQNQGGQGGQFQNQRGQRGQFGNQRGLQTQNSADIPGPTNYSAFSSFIALRNIFDPGRYAKTPGGPRVVRPIVHNPQAPAFAFVGAMAYSKGLFAFFDGNADKYRKVVQASGTIGGYTVKAISLKSVKLEAGGATIDLPVGKQMVYDDSSGWSLGGDSVDYEGQADNSGGGEQGQMMGGRGRFNDMGGGAAASVTSSYGGAASTAGVTSPVTPALPAASGAASEVLKQLMLKRQQESK